MHVAVLPFRRQPVPGAQPEQLRRAGGFLGYAGEIRGDGIRDIAPRSIPQCPTQDPTSAVDEEQTFVGTLEDRKRRGPRPSAPAGGAGAVDEAAVGDRR